MLAKGINQLGHMKTTQPSKNETYRERVERIMIDRFMLDSDQTISDEAYKLVMSIIDNPLDDEHEGSLLWQIANSRKVQGFTNEDLYSLMCMQVHQVLRRGMYDPVHPKHNIFGFFKVVFNQMINDLNRRKDVALKYSDEDALDTYLPLNDNKDF